MAKLIFVNLPVSDLARATAFYQAIGAEKNQQFCDETASCMVFSETIHAMLLTHDKFRQFTPKKIADARTCSEVLICISADSRDEVDHSRIGITGTTKINRADYGLTWNKALEAGGVLVGDEVAITLEVEFVKKNATVSQAHN